MWEQIKSNRIRTVILVIGMGAFLVALGWSLGYLIAGSGVLGLVIALAVFAIMNLVALAQGDNILLSVAGARKIKREDHPQLWNVVEEMQIASGLAKMPDVYIVDDPALNAFSTGRDLNHASVAITSGLLQKLNRDELQGVIAHEIGHVKNRDVSLMAWCSILLGTIVMLSYFGSRMMFFGGLGGRRNSRSSSDGGGGGGGGGGAAIIILIVSLVLMILAPIFAQLIYFAVSRKREYLADASGALFTRNPEGLASALEKLAASTVTVQKANKATAPMYMVNPFRGKNLSDLSSTHPPIQERIRILRAMAGHASYSAYNQAYQSIHGKGSVISPQTATLVGDVPARPASADSSPVEPVTERINRTREVQNMLQNLNNYAVIDCDCGTKLKIPPALRGQTVQCPHCGRLHQT
jgi:heat shock protein HtpX